jgi:hypothetical protein
MSTIFADVRFLRGPEENLPSLDEGQPAFTEDTKRVFVGSNEGNVELTKKEDTDKLTERLDNIEIQLSVLESGATESRPTSPVIGQVFYDTTLGKPIYCKVGGSTPTWTDAAGTTV